MTLEQATNWLLVIISFQLSVLMYVTIRINYKLKENKNGLARSRDGR